MKDKLFKNSGELIQKIALVLFVLELLACVITGFALIFTSCKREYSYYSYARHTTVLWHQTFIGLGVLTVGSFICFFKCLLLQGFGELVSNSHKLVELKENESEDFSEDNSGEFFTKLKGVAPLNKAQSVNPNPSVNEWKCPKCGSTNQNYVGTCGCGEKKPE